VLAGWPARAASGSWYPVELHEQHFDNAKIRPQVCATLNGQTPCALSSLTFNLTFPRPSVSMASNKAALKAAKSALDAHRWDDAIVQAQKVLTSDGQNYFAYVLPTEIYDV